MSKFALMFVQLSKKADKHIVSMTKLYPEIYDILQFYANPIENIKQIKAYLREKEINQFSFIDQNFMSEISKENFELKSYTSIQKDLEDKVDTIVCWDWCKVNDDEKAFDDIDYDNLTHTFNFEVIQLGNSFKLTAKTKTSATIIIDGPNNVPINSFENRMILIDFVSGQSGIYHQFKVKNF